MPRLLSSRQDDLEHGPVIIARRDRPAVTLDDRLDDRQAEPAAAGRLARGVGLVEAIEDQRQVLDRNPGSAVSDSQ
jgi:hypothetical protein